MSVAFDTLKAARRLSAAGFSDDQAEVLAGIFSEGITKNLTTKDDIALVRKDVKLARKDMEALDQKIDTSTEALDSRIDQVKETLETKIESASRNTIIWPGGAVFAAAIALNLMDRYFPPPG